MTDLVEKDRSWMPGFGVVISELEQKSPEKSEATSKQQNG